MKKLFIWWHRRRAIANQAKAATQAYYQDCPHKYMVYAKWHLEQIERMNTESKIPKDWNGA